MTNNAKTEVVVHIRCTSWIRSISTDTNALAVCQDGGIDLLLSVGNLSCEGFQAY